MTLQLFVSVITLTNELKPVAQGLGAGKVLWFTAKARTNGFTLASNLNSIDGFQIPAGLSLDIPISDFVGKLGIFSLDSLYWKNTVSGTNAIVEVIGMRDI